MKLSITPLLPALCLLPLLAAPARAQTSFEFFSPPDPLSLSSAPGAAPALSLPNLFIQDFNDTASLVGPLDYGYLTLTGTGTVPAAVVPSANGGTVTTADLSSCTLDLRITDIGPGVEGLYTYHLTGDLLFTQGYNPIDPNPYVTTLSGVLTDAGSGRKTTFNYFEGNVFHAPAKGSGQFSVSPVPVSSPVPEASTAAGMDLMLLMGMGAALRGARGRRRAA